MEVLFEYRGSRKELAVGSLDNLTDVVTAELRQLGRTRAVVLTSNDNLPVPTDRRQSPPEVYLLQKWSALWDCYVDVRHTNDVKDGDRLAVLARPKPPSKVMFVYYVSYKHLTTSTLPPPPPPPPYTILYRCSKCFVVCLIAVYLMAIK